jgi:uncharacterized protein YbaR (Trm112 family)
VADLPDAFLTMPIDADFLDILACPACKTKLVLKDEQRLLCTACHRSFPIRDEIPILLLDEATQEEPGVGAR